MFADTFLAHADRPCLRDADRTLTYAEVSALGRDLVAALPATRTLVALRCSLTIESVAAYIALLNAGHVPLLLEADLAPALLDQLVALYRPHSVWNPATSEMASGPGNVPVLHDNLALLLTTSGSTGSPKLVRLKASGVVANARAIADYLGLTPDERPMLHLPMSYSFGMSIINSHIAAGACVCLTQRTVMEPGYWEDLARFEATSVSGVPFHFMALRQLGLKRLEIPSLTTLTQAGGKLDPRLTTLFAKWAADSGRRFFVMYGQTEAGPRITYLPPDKALESPDAIGVPVDGVTIDLLDEDGAPVAPGERGEMVVRGPSVMMGYALGSDDLAVGDLLQGSLATGDLATRGADGLLRIVGRRSRVLKIFGLRVNLDEVERRLGDDGHTALVFGEDDKMRVLIDAGSDAAAVRQAIIDLFSLPPRGIDVRAGAAPARTAAGKISAAALAESWETAGATGVA
jgi:long-chain acyl-CoA synthetase